MTALTTEYVDLGDIRIAYCQHGSGRPLLLLHGNSGSKSQFKQHQLEHFPLFHTLALDSRGHGQSRSEDRPYTITQISRDVIAFCRAKGISEAFVVGYSDGGNIALLLARDAPEMFTRIVAISPNFLASGTEDRTLKQIKRLHKLMTFLKKLGINTTRQRLRFELMLNDIGISEDELRGIRTDMEILYAEHDMVKEAHILQLAGLIPTARVQKIAGCNHLTIPNNADAIAEMQRYLLAKTVTIIPL